VSTGAVECRRVLEHPPTVLAVTSMINKSTAGLQNSGTKTQLQQVFAHLHTQSLGERDCQVCREPIAVTNQIKLVLSKTAGSSAYTTDRRCYRDLNIQEVVA